MKNASAPNPAYDRNSHDATLRLRKLHPAAIIPRRWTEGAVGWDIHAHLLTESGRDNTMLIPPRNTRNVPTGLLIEVPANHMAMVVSRSGLAKHSIFVTNAPGVVDPDYRGELMVLLYNGSHESYYVRHQDRIAQLFLVPIVPMQILQVEKLSQTPRGESGFGSTGGITR